jgi:dihydrodipicolinate synthase/N-acetylneuraminate lyase
MRTAPIQPADYQGVFPVPPLARSPRTREIDWAQNDKVAAHITGAGITRLMYGGNAFLYHITLAEYEPLLGWLTQQPDNVWCIPSAGPSYGRLIDQASILKRYNFPAVMHLPCADPRDAEGLEAGLEEFSQRAGTPLIVYCKEENNWGANLEAGLDAIARLVARGVCVGIKYAVVRPDPAVDPYLQKLLQRVDKSIVLSGIGERPALVHMRDFGLPGYTTGSGCVGAASTQKMFELAAAGEWEKAAAIRENFIALEDIRDANGPARVLHAAVSAAGIADCGPIPHFVSALPAAIAAQLPDAVAAIAPANAAA